MNYYISDLHLFHKNVTRAGKNFDDRPFDTLKEMHTVIREKWNAKVTDEDTVYILGDMAMHGTQEELFAFVSTLKGHKIMVQGNHDQIRDPQYRQLFDEICAYKEMEDISEGRKERLVLCHYPILMWKNQHHGSILIYGHVHNSVEEYYFKKCLREMNHENYFGDKAGKRVLRAYNVGCMMPYMDYEPRSLEELAKGAEDFR